MEALNKYKEYYDAWTSDNVVFSSEVLKIARRKVGLSNAYQSLTISPKAVIVSQISPSVSVPNALNLLRLLYNKTVLLVDGKLTKQVTNNDLKPVLDEFKRYLLLKIVNVIEKNSDFHDEMDRYPSLKKIYIENKSN